MSVTLREITKDTVRDVIRLSVAPEQQRFVAPNAVSLAQALFHPEAWYRAVHDGDTLVGFVMLHDESQASPPPAKPRLSLWRLMVDQRYQRKGIGRAIMARVFEHARSRQCFAELYTSYVDAPGGPEPFYRSLGFVPNGEVDEGEIVIVAPLEPAAKET